MSQKSSEIVEVFNSIFYKAYGTKLVFGPGEPLYQPADDRTPFHQVIFAHGFPASALHESSHWCIAGKERRRLLDYGYWYKPEGRNQEEQEEFEKVAVKPQAIEWHFCIAAGVEFNISFDNFNLGNTDINAFRKKVGEQARIYGNGANLPPRAYLFILALLNRFETHSAYKTFLEKLEHGDTPV